MEKTCPAIFGVITIVFLCGGAFSPGWIVFDTSSLSGVEDRDTSDGVTLHMGLFYMLIVGKDFTATYGYGSDVSGSNYLALGFLEYQVETILGIVFCIISAILMCVYSRNSNPGMLLAPAIMYLIAGIATWIAVGRFLQGVIFLATRVDDSMGVPYSLIISGLGGIFLLILSIVIFVMFCQHNNDRSRAQTQGGVVFASVPMTGYPAAGQPPSQYEHAQTKTGYGYNQYEGPPPKY